MATRAKEGVSVLKKTFKEFTGDDCPQMAAAISYYTIFSLPPLLVIVILIAGAVWGQSAVEGQIEQQIGSLIGQDAGAQVQTMIGSASEKLSGSGGLLATLLSVAALLFGATGAFAQLQKALNRAWEVAPDPDAGGLKNFFMKRVLSFGMILGVAFLLLVSLALSAAIGVLAGQVREVLPAGKALAWVLNEAVALGIFTLLFAAMFKVLPDAEVQWKQVWTGAFVTALLFEAGKFLIGFYLGQSNPGSTFGAAGSLAVILVWVYYSSMILFLGAEFTQVWARRHGVSIAPSKGAVRVVQEARSVRQEGRGAAAEARTR